MHTDFSFKTNSNLYALLAFNTSTSVLMNELQNSSERLTPSLVIMFYNLYHI
jgi:hypothetical protein